MRQQPRSRLRLAGDLAVAPTLFITITALTASGTLDRFDRLVLGPRSQLPALAVTWLSLPFMVAGSAGATAVVALWLAIRRWRRDRRPALTLVLLFLAVNLVEIALKAHLHHPNPPLLRQARPLLLPDSHLLRLLTSGESALLPSAVLLNSYPSGHMARAVFLGLLVVALYPTAAVRRATVLALALLALVLCLSGAHWPSDIAGGALLGWAAAGLASATRSSAEQSSTPAP